MQICHTSLHQETMIPINKIAFIPGQLYKTNEVLVLLGDDWFSKISNTQALTIINKRLRNIADKKDALFRQRELIEQRINLKDKYDNILGVDTETFEINENYNEETEKTWRIEHRDNVKKYYQELAKNKSNKSTTHLESDPLPLILENFQDMDVAEDENISTQVNKKVRWEHDLQAKATSIDLKFTNLDVSLNQTTITTKKSILKIPSEDIGFSETDKKFTSQIVETNLKSIIQNSSPNIVKDVVEKNNFIQNYPNPVQNSPTKKPKMSLWKESRHRKPL
ncbi:unnamed protein product [Gordionus sp. m RMFG-2023]|uniref:unconventional prefoldin RPB5 interactor-like protein n=1 Tax=Gordionus sp. m RMFG-2023 TaxID=3053472 RepID=UPI0030E0B383